MNIFFLHIIRIQTDMNKHSESIASTHDIISGGISKELQKLGNVEISKKEPTKDTYVLVYVNTFSGKKSYLLCT